MVLRASVYKRQYSTDSSCCIREVLDFFGFKFSLEDIVFSVKQPFLEHLVPAEPVAPDGGGDVTPEGLAVEVDVERRVT